MMNRFLSILKESIVSGMIDKKISSFLKQKGFKEYSHGSNELGFVNEKSNVMIDDFIKMIQKIYTKARPSKKTWGDKAMSATHWVLIQDAAYSELVFSISSKDGKTLWNFTIKSVMNRD